MKRLLPFLARLVGISLLFVPVLSPLHASYTSLLAFISTAALPAGAVRDALPYDSFNNLYTFLVLILATPGMEVRRRIAGIVTGSALFLGADFFMTAIWPVWLKTPQPSLANMAVSYGWLVTAHYLLPFLLWFAFAFREVERLFRGAASYEKTPDQTN